jgi:hypothetical protein
MNTTYESSISFLHKIHACDESIVYASAQSDFQSIWNNCSRGDWLIWLASLLRAPHELVIRVSTECAKLAPSRVSNRYIEEIIINSNSSDLAAYSHEVVRQVCLFNPDTNIEMLNKCANIVRQIIKIDDLNISLLSAEK